MDERFFDIENRLKRKHFESINKTSKTNRINKLLFKGIVKVYATIHTIRYRRALKKIKKKNSLDASLIPQNQRAIDLLFEKYLEKVLQKIFFHRVWKHFYRRKRSKSIFQNLLFGKFQTPVTG